MKDFRERVDNMLTTLIATFGENIKYYYKNGGVVTIQAVFDNEYSTIDPDTEQLISANQPGIGVNLNDLSREPLRGDEVLVRNVRYRVIDSREDGQGGATLLLHRLNDDQKVDKRKYPRDS